MKPATQPLSLIQINQLRKKYGEYLKLTVDIDGECLVAGCPLHADGEKILLGQGSKQSDIWGGGIDLTNKEIDTAAVLNYRPNLNNPSMEILNPQTRNKFIAIVKQFFKPLWD